MTHLEKIRKADKKSSKYSPKLTRMDGQLSKWAQTALYACKIRENRIYPNVYQGSGRWTKLAHYEWFYIRLFEILGYKYTKGNDAPRGGAIGDYLKVSKTAISAIVDLRIGEGR